jgi:ferredoxin--NADP+ reductase
MSKQLGTDTNPLRVAIVGSGPSGFYAADYLLKLKDMVVEVDMFDRLPTPFGLVRGGVAPDHPKIKSVTKVYDRTAKHERFSFYGNVEVTEDITHEEMLDLYHYIIYAVGAQSDRKMGIPGEDLPGSHNATEFVAWYNGHPDYRHLEFDLSAERVAVVGVGNVAMDVARILARTYDELRATDIADYALEQLKDSNVKEIYVLGRRGPLQAAFTNPEIKELGEMEDAEVMVSQDEADLDPLSQEEIDEGRAERSAVKNVEILREYVEAGPQNARRKIIFRFLVSPVEIMGEDKVEKVRIVKNELYRKPNGTLRPRATEETEVLDIDLIFRSIGYRGVPLKGVPFREDWGIIPNEEGRIMTQPEGGEQVIGEYVVGWIKRGPSGIIGTNKPDSIATCKVMLEDMEAGKVLEPANPSREDMEALLNDKNIPFVTYEDWGIIDQLEIERGEAIGRPRLKFSNVDDMIRALNEYKAAQPS